MVILRFRAWERTHAGNKTPHMFYSKDMTLEKFFCAAEYDCDVMQSTGMFDRNGTEIYEGDIVTVYYYNRLIRGQIHIGNCVQDNNGGEYSTCYYGVGFKDICPPEGIWKGDCEWVVEGNIYENPELLEKLK
jgi:uncharacterized phage protein (TIGR01671 family)